MKNKTTVLLGFLLIVASYSCNNNTVMQSDENEFKIDSLIAINRINDNVIIVSFGYDAITAINTRKGVVVVDAGISSELTARYRKIIEKEFQTSYFSYLIITHGHPDHNGGNSVFQNASIVAHYNSIQELSDQWKDTDKVKNNLKKIVAEYDTALQLSAQYTDEWSEIFKQRIRYLSAYNDFENHIPIKYPKITFTDSLLIDMEDITIEMLYFGKCHSGSDILVYVPRFEILFVGDLFSKYGRPSINNKLLTDTDRWKLASQWIDDHLKNIEVIINGHGQVLTIDDLNSFNNNIKELTCHASD